MTKVVGIRIEENQLKELNALAEKDNRTVANLLNHLIDRALVLYKHELSARDVQLKEASK